MAESPIRLFITATNVATGRARVFRNRDLTPEVGFLISAVLYLVLFHVLRPKTTRAEVAAAVAYARR